MSRIKEVISLKTGYASEVDVRTEFFDTGKNNRRIESYRPIKGHREVFLKLSRSLYPNDRRCYFLSGSYGSGKSHLTLILANYLSNKSDRPEMQQFFENYKQVDSNASDKLKALRSKGRYLVAICNYGTRDDFEEVVLKALDDACKREGFYGNIDTHYDEAVRQLHRWKKEEESGQAKLDFYRAFNEELGERYPEYTYVHLISSLESREGYSLRVFKDVYRNVVGIEFGYDKSNLREILEAFLSSTEFKDRYEGLAILFDEFGYTLQNVRMSVEIFQDFAQLCTQPPPECQPVIFLATGHKSLTDYAQSWSIQQDFAKVSDRLEEIPLHPEGIEDIIGAIVMPDKTSPVWENEVVPKEGIFNMLVKDCKLLNIFGSLEGKELREKIIEGIYPLHPITTHCLLKLASEVGSRHRSVFRFFTGGSMGNDEEETYYDKYSYPWFIENHDILNGEHLRFYTVDLLVNYFKEELTSDNRELRERIRRILQDYEETVRKFNKYISEQLYIEYEVLESIIHAMLVFELAGINNRDENLAAGLLYRTMQDKEILKKRLDELCKAKALYLNPASQEYEFVRSDTVDLESLIDEFKNDPDNSPENLAEEVETLIALKSEKYIEAKTYNTVYREDKRFLRKFVLPGHIAGVNPDDTPEAFFTRFEEEMERISDWANSYEGIVLYVICETEDDTEKAKKYVFNNSSERIFVVVPRQPIPIYDSVMNLRALEYIKNLPEASYSTQDQIRIADWEGDENKGFTKHFLDNRRKYLEGKDAIWYTKKGAVLATQPSTEHEPLSKAANQLYTKRTKMAHDDFNLSHKVKYEPAKNYALREAVDAILYHHGPIKIDNSYGKDKGEIRYLSRLAQEGVLRQVGKKEGPIRKYEIEHDTQKYQDSLPALADMIEEIRQLKPEHELNVPFFLGRYSSPPYGLGPISLSIFFACVLRLLGDSILLRKDKAALGYLRIPDYEELFKLIKGSFPNAFLQHREITFEERDFLKKIYTLFSGESVAVSKEWTVSDVVDSMKEWWNNLPRLSKSEKLYADSESSSVLKLVSLFTEIDQADIYSLIFERLQTVYGYEMDDAVSEELSKNVTDGLKRDKEIIEKSFSDIRDLIIGEIGSLFNSKGSTYADVSDAIRDWYNSLDNYQKSEQANHSNESKELIRHFKAIESLEKTLLDNLPASQGFGLGKVRDWHSDQKEDYLKKINDGKMKLEELKVKVGEPLWTLDGEIISQKDLSDNKAQINYRGEVKITFTVPEDAKCIYITNTQEDPCNYKSQREKCEKNYTLKISGNDLIQFVAENEQGQFSIVKELSFINEDLKHRIILQGQQQVIEKSIQFVFPKDAHGLKVTLESLFRSALDEKIVEKETLLQIIREFYDNIEREI